jgi:hypothetical protein
MKKPSKEGRRTFDRDISGTDPADVERLQKDMLACLQKAGQDPVAYAGLAYCGPQGCGRVGCSEACWYGAGRRLRSEDQSIYNLLSQNEYFCEVRVIPGVWARPIGELNKFDVTGKAPELPGVGQPVLVVCCRGGQRESRGRSIHPP